MNLLEEDEMKLLNQKKCINPHFMKSGLGVARGFCVGRKTAAPMAGATQGFGGRRPPLRERR